VRLGRRLREPARLAPRIRTDETLERSSTRTGRDEAFPSRVPV
jgi:hypothetical protein